MKSIADNHGTQNTSVFQVNKSITKRHPSTILTGKKNRTDLVKALANNNRQDKCSLKMKNYWRSLDVFGEKVEFTFKGKRTYQTSVGAFFSLLIKLTLSCFIFYEMFVIFSRKHPAVSIKHNFIDLESSGSLNPFKYGFDLAVGLSTRNRTVAQKYGFSPKGSDSQLDDDFQRNLYICWGWDQNAIIIIIDSISIMQPIVRRAN
ncbi:hypothetical protein FGO68_gene5340 [Halteria grandinella]|uniref:Uncharacterized protein n=1 Tax=Halteria grandinella TaxID=5974 RepID=A0A8J8P2K0_HALGN|nr:hypothetical protein FGO68_gene5340 [Halteria grandinella]